MDAGNFENWLEVVFRRRAIALKVGAVVITVAVALTLLTPPLYESTAKVLIQDNRAQLLVSPGLQNNNPNQPSALSNPVTEQDLNFERDLLVRSYLVAQALTGLRLPQANFGPAGAVRKALRALVDLPAAGYRALHGAPEQSI
jgi:uncharacterized protein involved in exopolysaccharide biosynthesis